MRKLLECLSHGGRVLECVVHDGKARARVRTIAGDLVESFPIPSAGWIDWIVESRDERFPELAAAMRAKAMRDGAAMAVQAAAGTEGVSPTAVPAGFSRRRL